MTTQSVENRTTVNSNCDGYEMLAVRRAKDRLIGRPAVVGSMSLHPEVETLFKAKDITRDVSKCGVVYLSPARVRHLLDLKKQLPRWLIADLNETTQNESPLLDIGRMGIKALPVEARVNNNNAIELQATIKSDQADVFGREQRMLALHYGVPLPDSLTVYLGHLEGPVGQDVLDVAAHAIDATSPAEFRVGRIALL